VSNMAHSYVSDPTKIVSIHQHVMVKIMNVDLERGRIQLSLNV
jgi:uncharacterized protein